MPVQKFRTLEEASRALWKRWDDPNLVRAIAGLMGFSRRLAVVQPPPGVRRFRTLEEADAARRAWPVETMFKPCEPPPPLPRIGE